jgi:hypothetical protein
MDCNTVVRKLRVDNMACFVLFQWFREHTTLSLRTRLNKKKIQTKEIARLSLLHVKFYMK